MPTGLPPSIYDSLLNGAQLFRNSARDVVEYFEIPSGQELYETSSVAFRDVIVASKSSYVFLRLSLRPLLIFLALLSRHIGAALKVLAEHTVSGGIRGSIEFLRQSGNFARWFIAFQKNLSTTAIWIEASIVCTIIGLYALRRYIQKKRYVERMRRWHNRKRRALQLKYDNFVEKVAQTSTILALLLPHIIYCMLVVITKYFLQGLVDYLLSKTIIVRVISFYIPFLRTILVLNHWAQLRHTLKMDKDAPPSEIKGEINRSEKKGLFSSFMGKKKSKVADRYLDSISISSSNSDAKSKLNVKRVQKDDRSVESEKEHHMEEQEVINELLTLVKYWVVFSLLRALFRIFCLLPILGRLLSDVEQDFNNIPSAESTNYFGFKRRRLKTSTVVKLLSKLKISPGFSEELRIFFFIWLRYLPTSLTQNNIQNHSEIQVKRHAAVLEKKQTSKYMKSKMKVSFKNQPLDLMYDHLAPTATSLLNTTLRLTQTFQTRLSSHTPTTEMTMNNEDKPSFASIIAWCQSLLNLMVWTKLISERTKNRMTAALVECTALLPAAVTLLMPGYFTQYGVIYISLIVPAAYSADLQNRFHNENRDGDVRLKRYIIFQLERYLQYWIVHFIAYSFLASFSSILAWIPLSTHITWILWAYIQLESTTIHFYYILERDLIAFGLLNKYDKESPGINKHMDIEETMLMRCINTFIQKLPSGASSKDTANVTNAESYSSAEFKDEKKEELPPETKKIHHDYEMEPEVDMVNDEDNKTKLTEIQESKKNVDTMHDTSCQNNNKSAVDASNDSVANKEEIQLRDKKTK